MKSMFLIALLLMGAMAATAQQKVESGPWSIATGPGGPDAVAYKGQVLVQRARVSGFLPQWKGGRFDLSGGSVTPTAAGATWERKAPGNQDATLQVTATGSKVSFALETTLVAAGPTEYSVEIVPEAVRTAEGYCFATVDGRNTTLDLAGEFAQLGGIREVRFEQAERTVVVRCDTAMLQDRRKQGSGLFLVLAFGSDGGQPKTEKRAVEIEVLEAAPEEVPARRALLAQIPIERTDVPVANAGFESEKALENWTENPRATLDAEVKHGEKQSARVIIPAEQTDATGIYLTQQVPVQEGALYTAEAWIKTRGVKGATLGDKSATGGTIILEWADKDGKWLAPGDYADGSYGDTDWRLVTTKAMRAPKGAGNAVIFLSMRAHGTAWFDDVKFTEIRRNVVLAEPGSERKVADNTPRFRWDYSERADTLLELSTDREFPPAKTVSRKVAQTFEATPERPLAPGTWFWRVRIPGHGVVSAVWQFEQTAPLTQDCTEPVVQPNHAYLAGARQSATVQFSDNVGVKEVTLLLDGKDVTRQAKVGAKSATVTPAKGWAPGLHRLDVTVKDAAGNSAMRRLFLNHMPGAVRKEWLFNGGIAIGGKPQFLLGMYGVRTEDIPEMAAAGYDFVHNYTWDGPGTNESALQYLDDVRKRKMQAFIGFDRARLKAWDEEFVAERVGALCRHPGLLAWYLFDEPDLSHQFVPPDQLRALYRLIRALDPLHPVIVTVAQQHMVKEYNGSYDVYWSMDYATPGANARNFDKHREIIGPAVPMMSIVHCYDGKQAPASKGGNPDPEKFQPGPAMLRANAFMAIAHGSSGLGWWWWGQGSDIFLTVARVPAAWAALKETVRQIRALRPVLEAQSPARLWMEKPAEGIEVHLWERKVAGRAVIIAVNRDDKACDLNLKSPLLPARGRAKVLFEERTVPVEAGRLSDRFEPLAVHVYEVAAE